MPANNSDYDISPARGRHGRDLAGRIERFITDNSLIPAGSRVLAAVSGGQDSMAMLSILHRLADPLRFQLAVAHFDHRLRPSSAADQAQVQAYSASLDLPCYLGADDVRAEAANRGDNLEAAARRSRYRFLNQTAESINADRIATGHTLTDQVETVLFHIIRGTGLRGLAGIPKQRSRLIRPMLAIDREATGDYCRRLSLPVREDPTNQDTRFTRNRIRLELIPLIRDIQPDAVDNLIRLSHHANALLDWIRARTRPLLTEHLKPGGRGEWLLDISSPSRLDDTALVILFGDLMTEWMGLDLDLGRVHFEGLLKLTRKPGASGKRLSLPGLEVRREYNTLIFSDRRENTAASKQPFELEIPIPGSVTAAGRTIRTELLTPSDRIGGRSRADARVAWLSYDSLRPPLTVRSIRPGDRIQPFGMRGSKKLSDIFIDKKIPGRERESSLVVADQSEIVWLVGLVTCEKGRIGRQTKKILKIEVDPA